MLLPFASLCDDKEEMVTSPSFVHALPLLLQTITSPAPPLQVKTNLGNHTSKYMETFRECAMQGQLLNRCAMPGQLMKGAATL